MIFYLANYKRLNNEYLNSLFSDLETKTIILFLVLVYIEKN